MSSGAVARAWLRPSTIGVLFLGAIGAMGCGGGAALLHPAQTLPVDTVSAGAGVSGQFGSTGVNQTIDDGRVAAGQPLTDPANARAYAEGVLAEALIAPGASPWVSARVGLAENYEAGLTYTGRSLRLDGRHAWGIGEDWTLSVGIGASGMLLTVDREAPGSTMPGAMSAAETEPSGGGFGADLPVLFGYRLLEGFGDVWFGPRLGFEHLSGNLLLDSSDPASPRIDLSGNHFWGALLAGFSLGIPPLWLRFELSTAYHGVGGTLKPADPASGLVFDDPKASGWTFSPSGAIIGKF